MTAPRYDALLLVSFGGPEGPADVIPYLENVLRGRNAPRERVLQVAEHYQRFGGVSPLNAQNRALIAALERDFSRHGLSLPIFWGNRNWRPLLPDAMRHMADQGVKRCLAFVTSAFSSYSGCRQYRENIEEARRQLGPTQMRIDKLRVFFNHPSFIQAMAARVRSARAEFAEPDEVGEIVVYTAHSIPQAMADQSAYVAQLREAARLVSAAAGAREWRLAYQSRSGPPAQAWLSPDIGDVLREIHSATPRARVIVAPLGFLSDHMEVLYDLDVEARGIADSLGLSLRRAGTVGTHSLFIDCVRQLVLERVQGEAPAHGGELGPSPRDCAVGCCLSGRPGAESCVP